MANITAYIGRDYGVGVHASDHVIRTTLDRLAAAGIPGATFSDAIGYWAGDVEKSIRVELIGCDAAAAHNALATVCVDLMQWSILYVVDGRENVFIENDPTAARAAIAS